MQSIPISLEGFELVKEELARLKEERPEVIQAIKEAREEGDLSENGGYDAARERQGMLEAKIAYIESRIPLFNVIDTASLSGDTVTYGATVSLLDLDTDEEREYILVGPDEADFLPKTAAGISVFSPVARSLLGKEVGDEVSVEVPRGRIQYEITDLAFNGPFIKK
ncbi:MAG: transcription elongation factor GreA [Desulfovibrionaceae bacterium]|nr:transcription elongation factor GreA [Desulfovibrionaceae bacterium]